MMAQPGAASDCEEGVVKVVVGRDGKQQTFFSLKSDLVKYPFFSCLLDGEGHRREKEQQTVTLPEVDPLTYCHLMQLFALAQVDDSKPCRDPCLC
ncbi:unnamed protein product [Vitrella brassicaformis CCMP3155]|uniref:BTB domain-containing protein n=1 Tax=Vitrella brassicaformis (strain CCMP3155) TaxID=1169540 RepID=A0A0G4FYB7_VITBC|nr:unnamed protein product [Vitrella brassicaformis CCMP3155]|mmetsp:Transcript_33463/g.82887  ORF Transcript_33463/g.82887 Transcript_33463/m.82887 type:complete len:95 (+) Transcript_33463:66-350(+)|eukprot:CEM20442.1 unnamed protein product [Vitrella brassicaformis CCMP3155]